MSGLLRIRRAGPEDAEVLYALIVALAEYERMPNGVTGSAALLREALSAEPPHAEALIAEVNGEPAGFALFHGTFSTWECRPGIWLEDLFVAPEHRRAGVGRSLLCELAAIAVERGCPRLEWNVLAWNELALGFYGRQGAEVLTDWRLHRLSGEGLAALARAGDAR